MTAQHASAGVAALVRSVHCGRSVRVSFHYQSRASSRSGPGFSDESLISAPFRWEAHSVRLR
jgi:hypothetical protein